jgi:hypothetical protein
MTVAKKINKFKFTSLNHNDSETIKNGIHDFLSTISQDQDKIVEIIDALEDILEACYEIESTKENQVESFHDLIELVDPLILASISEDDFISKAKRIDQVVNHYNSDPLLVSILEVMHSKIYENYNYANFFEEISELFDEIMDNIV